MASRIHGMDQAGVRFSVGPPNTPPKGGFVFCGHELANYFANVADSKGFSLFC